MDGVPISCIANICETTTDAKEIGALGGACGENDACGDYKDGILECMSGMCELAGCPSGLLGCPCGPYGSCETYHGESVGCAADGRCEIGDCIEGTAGCRCRSESGCEAPLVCNTGICTGPTFTISIGNGDVRSCDMMINHNGAKVVSVKFDPKLVGEYRSKAPSTAFSFISRGDEPPTGAVIQVELTGTASLTTSSVYCNTAAGTPVQAPSVAVQLVK